MPLEKVEAYDNGNHTGPDLDNPAIDMISTSESRWNEQLIRLIYGKMAFITSNDDYPNIDAYEYKFLIRCKLKRVRTIWKRAQKRVKHDATLETTEERDLRCKTKNDETSRNTRQSTRRNTVSAFVATNDCQGLIES